MNLLSDRLQYILDAENLSQTELARKVGKPASDVSKLVNGTTKSLKDELLFKVAKALRVDPEWLATGKGDPQPQLNKLLDSSGHDSLLIPMFDLQASAGNGKDLSHAIIDPDNFMRLTETFLRKISGYIYQRNDNLAISTMSGDSMQPTIRQGDLLLFRHCERFEGEGIYLFEIDTDILVKRLQRLDTGISVISDNDKYQPWRPQDPDSLRIRGRVIYAFKGEAL